MVSSASVFSSSSSSSSLSFSLPSNGRRRSVPPSNPCYTKARSYGYGYGGGLRISVKLVHDSSNHHHVSQEEAQSLERKKALQTAMDDINSSFGKGSVTRLGGVGRALVETFPSGCLTLDFALGGGLPKGRIVEIYGLESSGKTTLALSAIAQIQVEDDLTKIPPFSHGGIYHCYYYNKLGVDSSHQTIKGRMGGNAVLVDAEHAFDSQYSRELGVDVDNLIVCQPDSGEMALETADRLCRSGAVDIICIDSVSALTPRAEIEGEIGTNQIGLQARLMSQALRKMSGNASKAGCTLVFLNQIRYKVVAFGNPEVTSGGLALKFFSSLRLEIRSVGKLKSGEEDVGIRARVRVQKSKVSKPYKQAEFDIIFGKGISREGCILDCSDLLGVVAKRGSWYSYGDTRLGQGRDKVVQYLHDNAAICDAIEKEVRARILEETSPKADSSNNGVVQSLNNHEGHEDYDSEGL